MPLSSKFLTEFTDNKLRKLVDTQLSIELADDG